MLLAALLATLAGPGYTITYRAAADSSPPALVGEWHGTASIFSNWTRRRQLEVSIVIAADGSVRGFVGDAVLRDARLHRNRSAVGRFFHLKTDWIVEGGLDGEILADENVTRGAVSIPLNLKDGHLLGSVQTNGGDLGGAASATLTAGRLDLQLIRKQP